MSERFDQCKTVGRYGEERVMCALLLSPSRFKVQDHTQHADHDIWVELNGVEDIIEVKNEDAKWDTGNIAIECYRRNRTEESGLSTTVASLWVHTLRERVVVYRVADMFKWLREHRHDNYDGIDWRDKWENADLDTGGPLVRRTLVSGYPWCDECLLADLHASNLWSARRKPPQ